MGIKYTSSLSRALRSIPSKHPNESSDFVQRNRTFRVRVASDRAMRERAYRLAYRIYEGPGYVREPGKDFLVSRFDAFPSTFTLLAETADGEAVATLTAIVDADGGLQCDRLYRDKVDVLRRSGRRLGQVTRLAIDKSVAHSKPLLAHMFNFAYLYGRNVRGVNDTFIEVNPRHVAFYERMMGFTVIGNLRCEPGTNTPVVLLRHDLEQMAIAAHTYGGKGLAVAERTLYSFFFPARLEPEIASALARDQHSMNADDLAYFGLATTASAIAQGEAKAPTPNALLRRS